MKFATWPSWLRALAAAVMLASAALVLWPDVAKRRGPTWEDLMKPLLPGGHITRGYVLTPPRRGEERDVVFSARREDPSFGPIAHVEVHVVDRGQWPGIRETKSFGVAYETPRSNAPAEDLEAVTEAIANHLRANDTGFGSVSTIPLEAGPAPPWITRALDGLNRQRAMLVALLVALACWFVSTIPKRGDVCAAALVFTIGLALRLPHLDVPFTHDQDVQRLFPGQLPLSEILTGRGLDDRHPPLWFVVLHAAGLFGQTETIMRLPAVLTGALCGPAIIWATRLVHGRAGAVAALCGAIVALSPTLVLRSREVSEIPLFSLLVIIAIGLSAALSQSPSRRLERRLAVVTALMAWTYYLAPLVFVGLLLPLTLTRRLRKAAVRAFGIGFVAAAPAFILGARIVVRDLGARQVAASFPELAWGQRSTSETLVELWTQATSSVGAATICAATISLLVATTSRRDASSLVASSVTIVAALGIAFASNIARVQPYYMTAIVPALPLSIALFGASRRTFTPAWSVICTLCLVSFVGTSLPGSGSMYTSDADAFMPRFSSFVLKRKEQTIVTVAHYDATLLAYYMQRASGEDAAWPDVTPSGELLLQGSKRRVLPLAHAHALDKHSGEQARSSLHEAMSRGPVLVIERDTFVLAEVHEALARCETLLTASSARLLRCAEHVPP